MLPLMAVPERIESFLREKGVAYEVHHHAETFTSVEEAAALGISAGEVAKVIVVKGGEKGTALVALPAARKVDMHALREALGDHHARLATESEMQTEFPDFALGSVPPFPTLVGAPLFLDRHIAEHERVVFAAGTHTDSISVAVADLRELGPCSIVEVCRQPEDLE